MKPIKQLLIILLSLGITTIALGANTPTPTPAQIEQFKNLPPEQQKLLAKQLGVDRDSIIPTPTQKLPEALPVVLPRADKDQLPPQNFNVTVPAVDLKPEELKYFGYDLFAGEPTTFTPVTEIPIPSRYVVGPGDEIVVQLFGKENDTLHLLVNRNGKILFPDLGPISVANLKFDEARKLIKNRIKNQLIGVDSSITLGELRSMRVFVLGEAYKPGSYEVSSLSTITNALFVSGGIKEIGSLRNIQLKRQGKLIENFDLYDLLLNGDTSKDLRLLPGDVVFIPSVTKRISVKGEVIRPAYYEFKKGETIADFEKMFGGLSSNANAKTIQYNRIDKDHVREVISLNLMEKKYTRLPLRNGDEMVVGAISDFVNQTVKVTGAVTRSGLYRWHQGLHVSDVITSLNTDVMKITDLDYSIIVREVNQQHDIEVLQFSLGQALQHQDDSSLNPVLNSHDEIIVFSNLQTTRKDPEQEKIQQGEITDEAFQRDKPVEEEAGYADDDYSREALLVPVLEKLEQQRSVGSPYQIATLAGEVRFPGDYPLTINSHVSDLLKAGGGLKDSAFALSAEVTRTYAEQGKHVKIKHINIDLNNTFNHIESDDLTLQSRDVVTVRIKPEWNEVSVIELKGEVLFPGKYVIQRGETLSQVIKRAGGVTKLAYLKGAVFMRQELKEREAKLLAELKAKLKNEIAAEAIGTSGVSLKVGKGSQLDLVEDIDSTEVVGRLVIDLQKIISDPEHNDLQLKNKDILVVPPNSQTITIIGQVQHPTSHIYNKNLDVNNYISMSGGVTPLADEDRIYLIKANGAVVIPDNNHWFGSSNGKIEAGDTIIVPLDTSYTKTLQLWTSVTQILYQSAVALAAIGRI